MIEKRLKNQAIEEGMKSARDRYFNRRTVPLLKYFPRKNIKMTLFKFEMSHVIYLIRNSIVHNNVHSFCGRQYNFIFIYCEQYTQK